MKKGAKILEEHDFSTFRASSCSAKSPIKKMLPLKIKKINDMIKIKLISKSFLQNQVRSIVGCLNYLSTGRWNISEFKGYLNPKNLLRSSCSRTWFIFKKNKLLKIIYIHISS